MNKHQAHDLKQMQSLPLEAKIRMSTQRIESWFVYWEGEVYVSFSGGIDSTVLADLVARVCKRYCYKLYLLFVNTGLEYPEIQKFVKTFVEWLRNTYEIDVQLDIVRPEIRFDEVLKNHGYPVISKHVSQVIEKARRSLDCGGDGGIRLQMINGCFVDPKTGKLSQYNIPQYKFLFDSEIPVSAICCDVMKKHPAHNYEKETGRKPFIGTMADESRNRKRVWEKYGCNAFEKEKPSSQPLSFWTKQDILHYVKKYNVLYCSVYGDIQVKPPEGTEEGQINVIDFLECYEPEDVLETTGCDRTGGIFCMFGCHLEKEPNRFQRLKETHPRQYEYCINGGEMVDGKWQPSKEGLGLGKVLDYIGVKYD